MKQTHKTKGAFIFGIRPVLEAIQSGKTIEKVMLRRNLQGEAFRELFQLLRTLQIPFQMVPVERLNRLSKQNHQGVIAWISEIEYQPLDEVLPAIYEAGRIPMIVILDRITDVRNMGAIARTAVCAGADALVIPSSGSALINSEAIKTSAGALYSIPVCRVLNLTETVKFLKLNGLQVIGATEKASNLYTGPDYTTPTALIMGSEGEGISDSLMRSLDELIMIPLEGAIESLNVSVAAGVILFEIQRQRRECIS